MLAGAVAMAARSAAPLMVIPQRGPSLVSATADSMAMRASPIEPSWILAGAPVARVADHSKSHDEAAITAVWDCTAGEFRWYFHWDETVMILEGEVHITAEDGSIRVLRAGDIAYFTANTWATWRVDDYVKKVAFLRKPFPTPVALAYRLRNMLGRLRNKAPTGLAA